MKIAAVLFAIFSAQTAFCLDLKPDFFCTQTPAEIAANLYKSGMIGKTHYTSLDSVSYWHPLKNIQFSDKRNFPSQTNIVDFGFAYDDDFAKSNPLNLIRAPGTLPPSGVYISVRDGSEIKELRFDKNDRDSDCFHRKYKYTLIN